MSPFKCIKAPVENGCFRQLDLKLFRVLRIKASTLIWAWKQIERQLRWYNIAALCGFCCCCLFVFWRGKRALVSSLAVKCGLLHLSIFLRCPHQLKWLLLFFLLGNSSIADGAYVLPNQKPHFLNQMTSFGKKSQTHSNMLLLASNSFQHTVFVFLVTESICSYSTSISRSRNSLLFLYTSTNHL